MQQGADGGDAPPPADTGFSEAGPDSAPHSDFGPPLPTAATPTPAVDTGAAFARSAQAGAAPAAWQRIAHRPLRLSLPFSVAVHLLLISLMVSGQGLGLPGLALPWQERRGGMAELRVELSPLLPAPTPSAAPAPQTPEPSPAADAAPAPPTAAPAVPLPSEAAMQVATAPSPVPAAKAPQPPTAPPTTPPPPVPPRPSDTPEPEADRAQTAAAPKPRLLAEQRPEAPALNPPLAASAPLPTVAPTVPDPPPAPTVDARAQREAERREAERQQATQREAERRDAERQQATQREAERREAERQQAAQREAERREAERQQTTQREAERREAERLEAGRQAAAKQDAARLEAPRAKAAQAAELAADEARREERLRAIGRQLNEEAAQRDAAALAARQPSSVLPPSWSSARRARLFGRTDPNAELQQYAEAWARRIQLNTPPELVRELARRPHAAPVVTVALRRDGTVESVTFTTLSGSPEVDEAVRRIVQRHQPYPAFSPLLAQDYDVVEIRRAWVFNTALWLQ